MQVEEVVVVVVWCGVVEGVYGHAKQTARNNTMVRVRVRVKWAK